MTSRRPPAGGANGPNDPAVGYGKPPVHTRFKAGQSGNPKGRAPGARSFRSDLEAELRVEVPVSENGKTTLLRKQVLAVKALVNKAAKGDARALSILIDQIGRLNLGEEESRSAPSVSADDAAIMQDFLNRHGARNRSSEDD